MRRYDLTAARAEAATDALDRRPPRPAADRQTIAGLLKRRRPPAEGAK